MGKKVIEEVGKIILMCFITFLLTSISIKRTLIDSKLSEDKYEEDQARRWGDHDKIHDLLYDKINNTDSKVDWLYENEIGKKNNAIPPLRY